MPQKEKPLQPNGLAAPKLTDYIITQDGKVWSKIKCKYLKGGTIGNRYRGVYLKDDNGHQKWYYIHRLVALLYCNNPLNKPDVDHIDNDKLNNNYTNLQWVTHQENIQLSITRDGRTYPRGEDHWLHGKPVSNETKAKMSAKKIGEKHPRFRGYYHYQDQVYTSMLALAKELDTYVMKIKRMVKQGLITFVPAVN